MPYTLTFDGSFFQIADFIEGLDSLVETTNDNVAVDGRLITIDGFSLAADPAGGFPALQATFSVTTYLTPPDPGRHRRRDADQPGAGRPRPPSRRRPEGRHETAEGTAS